MVAGVRRLCAIMDVPMSVVHTCVTMAVGLGSSGGWRCLGCGIFLLSARHGTIQGSSNEAQHLICPGLDVRLCFFAGRLVFSTLWDQTRHLPPPKAWCGSEACCYSCCCQGRASLVVQLVVLPLSETSPPLVFSVPGGCPRLQRSDRQWSLEPRLRGLPRWLPTPLRRNIAEFEDPDELTVDGQHG